MSHGGQQARGNSSLVFHGKARSFQLFKFAVLHCMAFGIKFLLINVRSNSDQYSSICWPKFYLYEDLKSRVPEDYNKYVILKLSCGALAGLFGQPSLIHWMLSEDKCRLSLQLLLLSQHMT